MSKTLIGINVLESVNGFAYASHIRFFSQLKIDNPNDQFLIYTPYRMAIDTMRNSSMKIAVETGCDYVFFIDDDMIIDKNTYNLLKAADKDVIMALTYIRGYPFQPMFFKAFSHITDKSGVNKEFLTHYDDFKEHIDENGLVKCQAVGFACTLIKVDMIKAIAAPWCLTGPNHTEDVYFCNKARYTLDPEPEIYCHTRVPTGHMMMPDMVIDWNVEKLRELYKKDTPLGKSREDRIQDTLNILAEKAEAIDVKA